MTERKYSAETIGPKVDGLLRKILNDAGIRLSFDIRDVEPAADDFETPDVVVQFSGPDIDLLLSNRAELLLALEHVTMEMLHLPSDEHSRLSFDANDYRLLRIEELRISAGAAADKVKRTGQPFRFNPMNSRERRVIHLSLRNETDVRSESSGSGPFRQVIVYPAGMASLPELPPPPPEYRRSSPGGFGDRGGRSDRGGRGGPGGPGGRGGPRGRGPRR